MGRWAEEERAKVAPIPADAQLIDLTEQEFGKCLEVLGDQQPRDSGGDASGRGGNARAKPPAEGCCITCQGLLICGTHVVTECGECSADL